ncbi:MAG: S1 RNA-binding domain-containing protein [Anaerolineae bacterium]|nr:S1 RNA-binding domain-containing protein [Anaerolineae bacterium]MCX8068345.1 S1 RNA-binding domain-containing protein [Anaerolineae bacterium]MDW7992188.1 S1 RNA-binding domain-containing protein [Anaerolineae bacterium]
MVEEWVEQTSSQPEMGDVDMATLLRNQEGYIVRPGDLRKGRVLQVSEAGVLVDIGLKRECFVPTSDLQQMRRRQMGEVREGDEVLVKILESEGEGYIKASIYQARLEEDWIRAEEMLRSGAIYEGKISAYNRGGLTVPFGRIRGFIPLSQIVGIPRGLKEEERRKRLAAMVGQTVGLRVVDVDRVKRRLILSQRRAYRAWQRILRKRLLESLEIGQRRKGRVSSVTDFGAFVDLGGVEGLVHVSELSWRHVENPREVVKVGDEVEVVVLEVNRSKGRVGLSIKQTQEDPWKTVKDRYRENQLVEGRILRVTDIGAIVELEPGVEGLLHSSELVGAPDVKPQDVLKPGETILLKILDISPSRRRIRLSARRVRREEWERWAAEKAARGIETRKVAETPAA